MFSTPYFGMSPFGEGDQTAQTEKMTSGSQFGLQEGNWYSQNQYGMIGQDSPWLVSESDAQARQQKEVLGHQAT